MPLGVMWDHPLDLLTPHKPNNRAPGPVQVGLFDRPLERVALRLSSSEMSGDRPGCPTIHTLLSTIPVSSTEVVRFGGFFTSDVTLEDRDTGRFVVRSGDTCYIRLSYPPNTWNKTKWGVPGCPLDLGGSHRTGFRYFGFRFFQPARYGMEKDSLDHTHGQLSAIQTNALSGVDWHGV